jgi:hypothetical protein
MALPLERIGALMSCHWTQVRGWRQKAEREQRIRLVQPGIPKRRATLYLFCDVPLSL